MNNQESIHALMFLFGDRGLPSSVRQINAYSGNTYKFSKADGSYHYTRIHVLTNQGNHYFTNAEGSTLAGTNPDHHIQDLQESINSGQFPSWDVCVQTIRPEEIVDAPVDIFDMTKIWPHKNYPLRRVGRLTLCKNPDNWFAEIEQAAFSPSNMVKGIEPSPDPMLQARMFAYPDAARYRLGINYQFLPTNAASSEVYCPTERDGFMNFTKNYGGDPNYVGSKIKPTNFFAAEQRELKDAANKVVAKPTSKEVDRYDQTPAGAVPESFASAASEKDFTQATSLWRLMRNQDGAQKRFVDNVSAHVSGCEKTWLRDEVYGTSRLNYGKDSGFCSDDKLSTAMFAHVDEDLGESIKTTTEDKIKNKHLHPHKTAWH